MAIQRKYRVLLMTLGFVVVGILSGVIYVFNKPHRDIANEKPAYTLTDADFFKQWEDNEEVAHTIFDNRVIQVNGECFAPIY